MGTRTPPPEKRKPQMSGGSETGLQCPPIHSSIWPKKGREIAEINCSGGSTIYSVVPSMSLCPRVGAGASVTCSCLSFRVPEPSVVERPAAWRMSLKFKNGPFLSPPDEQSVLLGPAKEAICSQQRRTAALTCRGWWSQHRAVPTGLLVAGASTKMFYQTFNYDCPLPSIYI